MPTMKALISSLILCLQIGGSVASAQWVQETAGELSVAADWTSDGLADLLVVDRATGLLRAGIQDSGGTFVWSEPQAAGPGNITAIGFGAFFGSSAPALAVTTPALNRLNLVRYGVASAEPWFVGGIGPRAMALTLGGPDGSFGDLFIATSDNGAPNPHRLENWRAPSQLAGTNTALARGQSVGTSGDLAFLARAADVGGTADTLFLYPYGDLTFPTVAGGLPLGVDWAWGVFGVSTESFLFWKTGSPTLTLRPLNRFNTPLAFEAAVDFTLGAPIFSVTVLSGSGSPRLLIVFSDGASAGVFTFDGINAPVMLQSFTPPVGGSFRTVMPLENFDFALLSGPAGGTTSSTAQRHRLQPNDSYLADEPSSLPPLPSTSAARTNVLLFSSEPFVSPNAQLFAALRARDWSVSSNGLPGALNVLAETFQGSQSGLGSRQSVTLGTVNANPETYVLANQYAEDLSIIALSPATGDQVLTVHLTPPPGSYNQALTVLATSSPPGAEILYRRAASDAWTTFETGAPTSLTIEASGFVEIYARSGFARSSIVGGNYLIGLLTPQPIEGTGISAALWEYFGTPSLDEDPDNDGTTTGDELLSGTDPFYPDSITPGPFALRITSVDPPPSATLHFRLTGQPGIRYAVESSSTMTPGDWTDHVSEFTMPASGFLEFATTYTPGQRRFFRAAAR